MRRTLCTTIVCLLIMLIAAPSQAKLGYADKETLNNFIIAQRIFSYSGATFKEIKLKYWGQINSKKESLPELETKYLVLLKRLGLDPARKTVQIDRDGFTSLSQLEILSGDTIQIFIQSIPVKDSDGATYWGVSIQSSSTEQAKKYYELLKGALLELGCSEEPGVEFCGIILETLTAERQDYYLQQLANFAGARYVEGITEGNLTSQSLYTKEGTGWVSLREQKINLNLALRSNPAENKTNLHIGMPLIYSDY